MSAALALAIAAADLEGAPAHHLDEVVEAERAVALRSSAQLHGLAGLLDSLVASGRVAGDDAWRRDVAASARAEAARCVVLDAAAAEVSSSFAAAGIDHRLLKGAAIAHLDERDPVLRSYRDVDLLVRPHDVEHALARLATLGFERDLPERRPGFDRRFAKDVTVGRAEAGVDVHRTLALGPFGAIGGGERWWSTIEPVPLAGVDVPALGPEARFVHACVTVAIGDADAKVSALRDVALLSRRDLEVGTVLELAPVGRGAAVVTAAVDRCRRDLGDVVGAAGVAAAEPGRRPSRWERLALRSYRSGGGSNTAELLGVAVSLPRWRDRAAYLVALTVPSADYRRARAREGRPVEWRTALREVAARGRGR